MYSSLFNVIIHLSHHSETDLNDSIWVMREFHTRFFHTVPQTEFFNAGVLLSLGCSVFSASSSSISLLLHHCITLSILSELTLILILFDLKPCFCDCIIVALYLLQYVHNVHHVSTHPNIPDTCLLQISRKVHVTFPEHLTWCSNTDPTCGTHVEEFVDIEPLPHTTDWISSQTLWRKPPSTADQERHAFEFEQPHDRLRVGGNSQREPNQERNKSTVTTMAFSKHANVHFISVAPCWRPF